MLTGQGQLGQVITFYSFKGGTGRSMALANVACLLGEQRAKRGVLIIDWDLEAPGIDRYFADYFHQECGQGDSSWSRYLEKPGLLDYFESVRNLVGAETSSTAGPGRISGEELLKKLQPDAFWLKTDVEGVFLMKSGKTTDDYGKRVNTFNWERLYEACPTLFRAFAEYLARQFSYVLIDSRTGVTDTSGICTMLLPEKVVVVFTPNRQSLSGAADFVRRVAEYRRTSDDIRPLTVYPLPSRVEPSEPEKKADWRMSNPGRGIVGYQPTFETLFKEVYGLKECRLQQYFDQVQIQYLSPYSYGEEIACLKKIDRTAGRLSLSESYRSFLRRLMESSAPWIEPARSEEEVALHESRERLERAEKALESKSSVTKWLKVALGVITVFFALILVVAIPAYYDYSTRAQVSEAVLVGSALKTGVSEYFLDNEKLPSSNADLKLPANNNEFSGRTVKSANIGPEGIITITLKEDVRNVGGKDILFIPKKSVTKSGLDWVCTSNTIEDKYLPSSCRKGLRLPQPALS